MARNEAVLFPINCISSHKEFLARYDFAYDEVWVLTYGIKEIQNEHIRTDATKSKKIDITNSRTGPQYKCPYCGNRDFVRCGLCEKLTCYSGDGSFVCDHCGNVGGVSGTIESLEGNYKHSQ